ncbi:hypothetical protein GCM10023162_05600 [Klenkia terrae]
MAVEELVAGLRAAGLAEVEDGTRRRAEYSSDASNHRVVPTAVAYPRDADEVLAALAVCRELAVPLTMRGGGTSIAGNAIGPGLVLDTSRHLTRLQALDPDARTAVVQPGVVLDRITDAGAPHGLAYGPDPSTHSRATIGGTIGNNACGAHAMSLGRAADTVVSLQVATAVGEVFDAGPGSAGPVDLWPVVDANLAAVRTGSGRFRRQVSGYSLEHLLPERGRHVGRFLAGSEGTLAVLLQATVSLAEVPAATALVVLGYTIVPAAADAVTGLLPHAPRAVEGMDARLVDVVRRRRGAAAVPDLPRGDGWLFVEVGRPETGTPSTAGWPLPAHSATPAPEPSAESVSTRANEAPPEASADTCPATAVSTRSAPGPETPRQACSVATRAGEPGASTHSRPPARRATTLSPGRTSQRSGMPATLMSAARPTPPRGSATPERDHRHGPFVTASHGSLTRWSPRGRSVHPPLDGGGRTGPGMTIRRW